jgi:hypothetical protein
MLGKISDRKKLTYSRNLDEVSQRIGKVAAQAVTLGLVLDKPEPSFTRNHFYQH